MSRVEHDRTPPKPGRWLRAAVVCFVALSSCGDDSSGSFRVVLLGDASRVDAASVLADHAPGDVRLTTPSLGGDVMAVADDARNADLVLVVTSSTEGPTPIVREHVLLARQLRSPTVGLFLTRTDEVLEVMGGDRDLLDLVELELREILSTYELAGDTAPRFYDSESFEAASGPGALAEALASGKFPRRGPPPTSTVSGSVLDSEIYLLTELEASAVQPIEPASSLSLWIDGERVRGEAELATTIRPGDATSLRVHLDTRLTLAKGTRFFIERDGFLIGVGTAVALR